MKWRGGAVRLTMLSESRRSDRVFFFCLYLSPRFTRAATKSRGRKSRMKGDEAGARDTAAGERSRGGNLKMRRGKKRKEGNEQKGWTETG